MCLKSQVFHTGKHFPSIKDMSVLTELWLDDAQWPVESDGEDK